MTSITGMYSASTPTLSDGQQRDLALDAQGNLKVSGGGTDSNPSVVSAKNTQTGVAATRGFTNRVIQAQDAANNPSLIEVDSRIFNGTTWDMEVKTNLYARVPSSLASGSPANVKSSVGEIRGFWGENAGTKTYLQIYNKASAPVLGADAPILTYPIPANTVFSQNFGSGLYLSDGISYAFTTDAAGTTGSAAAAVLAFGMMMS